jgi:hypothetical protein
VAPDFQGVAAAMTPQLPGRDHFSKFLDDDRLRLLVNADHSTILVKNLNTLRYPSDVENYTYFFVIEKKILNFLSKFLVERCFLATPSQRCQCRANMKVEKIGC